MNYTLHQLQIFLKVAELKSITRASEELFLSQPAVSMQLKKFQEQFSIPLTEVIGRQLYVTEFGEEIAEASERILNEVEAINYKTLSRQGQLAGKLKIAIVSTAKYAMPYFLTDFMTEHSGVDLVMDVTNKAEVIKSLENNEVDFAMVSVLPDHLNLNKIELMQNKLFLVGGPTVETDNNKVTKRIFEKYPIIYREQGSATRAAMENFLTNLNVPNKKKIELKSNEALKQALIAGLGVSIMPLIGLKNELKDEELHIIPYKNLPIKTNWNLIWLKSKKLSPVANAYLEFVNKEKTRIISNTFNWYEDYN
ncbi:LysR family transcriptional regulator [Winogradskyella sp. PC-19]|uniref:LysR family transcriptional regulator n=1 Tax=unclassified Winogradskyella TaxID=2615021 RepID=UPI000B3C430D|nr:MULTISPECIES: LysR family transcriptional regulator [unclassified Winogradskyella]ARV08459.1 LysR family transcriptional regulator [Winogradskyella sp. PC-19]RZN76313.1 MAG: LysR family transcriptional regulator [Winogradskyella sp.]